MIEKETTVGLQTEPDNVFVIENEQKDQEKAKNASDPIGHNLSLGRRISQGDSSHMLTSMKKGESSIEVLADRIETRRAGRIPVPFQMRKLFLNNCRDVAKQEGYINKMSVLALHKLRDEYKSKVEAKESALTAASHAAAKVFGYWDEELMMLELLDQACIYVAEVDALWFFFRDFSYYNTVLAHRIRLFGSPLVAAIAYLFLFYLGSAVLFCSIMKDDAVCPDRDTYDGWLTAVYFASVTMSTVGYGDVNLAGGDRWRTFIGLLYMLVAMGMAYSVFSTAASAALSMVQINGTGQNSSILFRPFVKNIDDVNLSLHERVRRLVMFRVAELIVWFVLLNLIGVFVARCFIVTSDIDSQQWDWMTTLYWAVQTTTTIGYGDLDMPFDMRWFQIFFTTFGTAFVGAVFGAFAGLSGYISNIRRFYAWKRREISKNLIHEMQGSDEDDRVDQFEFMIGSLLMLNKVDRNDVGQIMDKFRELACDKGYILSRELAREEEELDESDEFDSVDDAEMQY